MVAHEFLGIGWGELMLLIVLAVIFIGPDKMPQMTKKAARAVYMLRKFAHQATSQLKAELGPEYQNLTIADLNPKTFVQKTLLAEMQEDLDDVKRELDGVKTELSGSVNDLQSAGTDVKSLVNAGVAAAAAADLAADPAPAVVVPYDTEAT